MRRNAAFTVTGVYVCFLATALFAQSATMGRTGEELFKENCAVCHPDGGNMLNPSKTLHRKDLEANGITNPRDIVRKMRNPGAFPTHPSEWSGMKMFDEKTISDEDALRIADYIINAFK
jgi:cytochrome c6